MEEGCILEFPFGGGAGLTGSTDILNDHADDAMAELALA